MRKTKRIQQLDKRPNARNVLRAADEFISKKRYIPPREKGGGRGGGGGQDGEVNPCEGDATCWEFPIEVLALMRLHRTDTNDPAVCQIQVSEKNEVGAGGTHTYGLTYVNMQGGDAGSDVYLDVQGKSASTFFSNPSNTLAFTSGDATDFWVKLRIEELEVNTKAWEDGSSEPGSWLVSSTHASAVIDPSLLSYLLINTDAAAQTTGSYFELLSISVTGYGDATLTDTFTRNEAASWGATEFSLGNGWVGPEGSGGIVEVTGGKGRVESDGTGSSENAVILLPCGPIETFTRTESSGLGISEFGPPWQEEQGDPSFPANTAVNGERAIFDTDLGVISSVYEWVDIFNGDTLFPIEVVWKVLAQWGHSTGSWTFTASMDGEPNPSGSSSYCLLLLDNERTGLGPLYTHTVKADLLTSEGAFVAGVTVATFTGVSQGEIVTLEAYIRVRLETNAVRARVWEVGDSEPSTWTLEETVTDESPIEGQLVSLGVSISNIENEGVDDFSRFEVDSIEVAEGIDQEDCDDEIVSADGLITYATFVDGPDEYIGGAVIPGIIGTCTRLTSTSYRLPSSAIYVKNVYIDNIQLHPSQWSFSPQRTLAFASSIDVDAVVKARYVPNA